MRLRSNCTSHKRTTRRALRMALTLALVAGPGIAHAAETLPPSFPAPLNDPAHVEAGLLPYPFEQAGRAGQATRAEKVQRLVRLVGLQHGASSGEQFASSPQPLRSRLPLVELETLAPPVVAASATGSDETTHGSSASQVTSKPATHQLPAAPTIPTIGHSPTLPVATTHLPALALPGVAAAALPSTSAKPPVALPSNPSEAPIDLLSDSFSESLIDIEIPAAVAQGASASSASSGSSVEPSRRELTSTTSHMSDSVANAGLVKPTQPLQLLSAAAESVAPPSLASTTAVQAPAARKPELVQASKPMSLSTPGAADRSVTLSLNDSASDVPTAPRTGGQRSVELHLSSASQIPLKTPGTSPALPQRDAGMQVRVEGEPAPLLAARAASQINRFAPSAPRPSMESMPRLSTATRAEESGAGKKVKAMFASRTTPLHDREPVVHADGREHGSMLPAETLSVGLQESQLLSTEFVIVELSVEHPTICQLMQTGETSVSLIGMRPGSTRIALITVNDDGERHVELREVTVATSTRSEPSLADMAKEISRKVAKMVPHSDVEIVAYNDYLLVHGFTPYESDAKKIVSLVRKTSLVPVVDQLKTNER